MRGVIDWLSPDRGFGFLRDDAGRAVSVARSEIEAHDVEALVVGQRVEFGLASGAPIPVAAGMRLIYQCQPCKDRGCGWCDWPR